MAPPGTKIKVVMSKASCFPEDTSLNGPPPLYPIALYLSNWRRHTTFIRVGHSIAPPQKTTCRSPISCITSTAMKGSKLLCHSYQTFLEESHEIGLCMTLSLSIGEAFIDILLELVPVQVLSLGISCPIEEHAWANILAGPCLLLREVLFFSRGYLITGSPRCNASLAKPL